MEDSIGEDLMGWVVLGVIYLIVKCVIWVSCGVGEWFQWLGDKF